MPTWLESCLNYPLAMLLRTWNLDSDGDLDLVVNNKYKSFVYRTVKAQPSGKSFSKEGSVHGPEKSFWNLVLEVRVKRKG